MIRRHRAKRAHAYAVDGAWLVCLQVAAQISKAIYSVLLKAKPVHTKFVCYLVSYSE